MNGDCLYCIYYKLLNNVVVYHKMDDQCILFLNYLDNLYNDKTSTKNMLK